jgi:predicted nucleic acid-binding protein
MRTYIMDACALIAFLSDEKGADVVNKVLLETFEGKAAVYMNSFNLLEVYYDIYRKMGKKKAEEELSMIEKLPISIRSGLSGNTFLEAGRMKASYRISIADSVALAETSISGGELLTADHHEFDAVEQKEKIKFCWIR